MNRSILFDDVVGLIGGVPLHEYQFGARTHLRDTPKDLRDIASFVARRNDDAYQWVRSGTKCVAWRQASDHKVAQRRKSKRKQPREIRIAKTGNHRQPRGQQNLMPASNRLKSGEIQHIIEVLDGEPVLRDEWMRQAQPPRRRKR